MTLRDLIEIAEQEELNFDTLQLAMNVSGTVFQLDSVDGSDVAAAGLPVETTFLFTLSPVV